MAKTANINIRIDPAVKTAAEELFASFGITVSDAVNIFLHQSVNVGGLPFEVKQQRYNAETEAAMREASEIAAGRIPSKTYASAKALFDELESEEDSNATA